MRRVWLALLISLGLTLVGAQTDQPEVVGVGFGFFPTVQFSPWFVAEGLGFYALVDLRPEYRFGFAPDLLPLLLRGQLDFLVADAEDVIQARAEGLDVVYISALYAQVPNAIAARADTGIITAPDLRGHTIGIPILAGSSYTSLQSILAGAGLTESDVIIREIGFTQVEALASGLVDAAMVFLDNEPIQLAQRGVAINLIPAAQFNVSLGNGLITTGQVIRERPDLVRRFVEATQRAQAAVVRFPDLALELSKPLVAALQDPANLPEQRQRLLASIALWESEYTRAEGIGFSDPAAWAFAVDFLFQQGRLDRRIDPNEVFTNAFLVPGVGVK
ncbi:MAG: ABC transporter substrate-binding protein [Deinococcus sp.]|nr:ABC transporter substrate-binding protein [Deinococcus sp.]